MKKNNIVIIVVILLLLLLLGAGGYLMLSKKTAAPVKTTAAVTQAPTNNTQTAKSLLDLIKMGQNVRCTFTSQLTNGSSDGTVYVSGQNIRGDFAITTDGKKVQTSMIRNGDTSYVWGEALPRGVKMTIPLDKLAQSKQASQYVDPNQKVNYNCSAWNVDSSLFTPPSTVSFVDMSSLLAPKTTGTQVSPQTQTNPAADPCSQITNETAKAACENALKQNGQ